MEDLRENEIRQTIDTAYRAAVNMVDEFNNKDNLDLKEICLYKMSSYIKSIGTDNVLNEHSKLIMFKGIIECLLVIEMIDDDFFDDNVLKDLKNYSNESHHRISDEFDKDYVKISNYAFMHLPIVYDDCMTVLVDKYLPVLSKPYNVLNVILHPNDLVYSCYFVKEEYAFDSLEYVIYKNYIETIEDYKPEIINLKLSLEALREKRIHNSKLLDITDDIFITLNSIIDKLVMVDVFKGKEEYLSLIGNHINSLTLDTIYDNKNAFNYKISLILELIATEYYIDTLFLEEDRIDLLKLLAGNTEARICSIFEDENKNAIIENIYPLIDKYKGIRRDDIDDCFLDNMKFTKNGTSLDGFIESLMRAYMEFNDSTEEVEDDYDLFLNTYISSDVNRYSKAQYSSLVYYDEIRMINKLVLFELQYLNSILDRIEPMSKKAMYELKKVKRYLPGKIKDLEDLMVQAQDLIFNM